MGKELKEGKITLKELAEWFGVSYDWFCHSKEKKMQQLKVFADYHLEPCGKTGKKFNIVIDKVLCPEYSSAYEEVKKLKPKYWDTHGTGVDTAARVGNEMWRKEKTVNSRIKVSTCENYTKAVEREEYGSLLLNTRGTKGYRKYVYCEKKLDKETGEHYYRPLTEDELKLIVDAIREAKIDTSLDESMFADEVYNNRKEYTTEELQLMAYKILMRKITEAKYENFIIIATDKLGFRPIKATKEIQCAENAEKAFDFA